MKFIFICLIIANAMMFAMWKGYIPSPIVKTHQPERLLQQQDSGHLKLISAELATLPQQDVPLACLLWGTFQKSELTKVETKLSALAFGSRQSRQVVQDTASTIVYIPPTGSKAAAEKKANELTNLGVHDFFIIQDNANNMRWGISLGVFKSEEAAKQLLATLISKGVRSAKLAAHTMATNRFNLVFNEVSSMEKAGLEKLTAEFPAQDLRVCN